MMSDDRRPDLDPSQQNPLQRPVVEGERRKEQDRRQADRQGKYDRRRNRCVHCVHFVEEEAGKGQCRFHQVVVTAYAFACPNFEP